MQAIIDRAQTMHAQMLEADAQAADLKHNLHLNTLRQHLEIVFGADLIIEFGPCVEAYNGTYAKPSVFSPDIYDRQFESHMVYEFVEPGARTLFFKFTSVSEYEDDDKMLKCQFYVDVSDAQRPGPQIVVRQHGVQPAVSFSSAGDFLSRLGACLPALRASAKTT